MTTIKDEAYQIIDALFDELGTGGLTPGPGEFVDGQAAIIEMIDKDWPSWKEVEWPGFYMKHKALELCKQKYPGAFQEFKPTPKLRLLKGKYIWDVRFAATATTDLDEKPKNIILCDTKIQENLLDEYNGLGLILVDAVVSLDLDGEFIKFLTEQKGKKSTYEKKRIADGRPPRMRKTEFMIKRVYASYYPKERFLEGEDEGWLRNDFQQTMRQYDASTRNPKYLLHFEKIPNDCKLFVRNFNFDRDDFEFIHNDPDIGSF
ncbi:MAG: hypothetical protein GPJ52_03155 [Candidatus Heimdallarchaeota archaeon]|nr:hypothetical protein [Candidatus Heimdallarchaeota archaeon]